MKEKKTQLFLWVLLFSFLLCIVFTPLGTNAESNQPLVVTIEVDDTVTSGTKDHIKRGIEYAEENNAEALVILLNTPGGLVDATLKIMEDIGYSNVPVITYVFPKNAIAASAGTFILVSGHVAAMAPGTTCGAAMPVTMAAEGDPQPADEKTINLLAEHMKSVAEERGRSGDVAKRFVTENLTLGPQESVDKGVINLTADNINELLEKIHGWQVELEDESVVLDTEGAKVRPLDMNLAENITHLVSNPQITVILFLLGVYGLIVGFNTPGTFFPEVLGAICLLLAFYGLGLFAVNILAALLILLGIILLVTEAFTPTYGVLGVGGAASLILGIIFLPMEPIMPADWFSHFRLMAVGIGLVGAVLLLVIILGVLRLRKAKIVHGKFEFQEARATVFQELNPEGMVKVQGEIWRARSKDKIFIPEGKEVKVVDRDGLVIIVEEKKDDY